MQGPLNSMRSEGELLEDGEKLARFGGNVMVDMSKIQ